MPAGFDYSKGNAINASGQVTGIAGTNSGDKYHAFLYSNGQFTDLGGTLPTSTYTIGTAINSSGQVVGYDNTGGSHAFLYTPGKGMVDLNTLLPAKSGWMLLTALGINDAGQITGYGKNDGATHAFLLSPQ